MSFWDIGKDLLQIKENKLYKEQYNNMDQYMLENFTFCPAQGWKFMKLSQEIKDRTLAAKVGFEKMYLLLQIPDQHKDEILEQVEDNTLDREGLKKEVKRLKNQAGSKPHYSDSSEEHCLRLIRQFEAIRKDSERFKEIQKDLHDSIDNWLKSAKKHQDERIVKLIKEALEILKEI